MTKPFNLPAAITSAYPTAAAWSAVESFSPSTGWTEGHTEDAIAISVEVRDAQGTVLAARADFRAEELETEADAHEIVRVRRINVKAIERAVDCPIEEVEDSYGDESYSVSLRAGNSWIEGPRGLLLYLARAAQEMGETNIREVGYDSDFAPATPDWMREKALQSMVDAAYRASRQISEQC